MRDAVARRDTPSGVVPALSRSAALTGFRAGPGPR